MTALVWDQVGERRFETGIDRGVLFLPDGSAVPWNGLTGIAENTAREIKSYYLDGVKYLDKAVAGSYSAKLSAFTYPDELDELIGVSAFAPGVFVHDQRSQLFHLSYRTQVGNDVDGVDYGYKIHIVYNVMASLAGVGMDTMGPSLTLKAFEWELTGTPSSMFGIRPTSHISIQSRAIDPDLLETIEVMLYGSGDQDPNLVSVVDFLELVEAAS